MCWYIRRPRGLIQNRPTMGSSSCDGGALRSTIWLSWGTSSCAGESGAVNSVVRAKAVAGGCRDVRRGRLVTSFGILKSRIAASFASSSELSPLPLPLLQLQLLLVEALAVAACWCSRAVLDETGLAWLSFR